MIFLNQIKTCRRKGLHSLFKTKKNTPKNSNENIEQQLIRISPAPNLIWPVSFEYLHMWKYNQTISRIFMHWGRQKLKTEGRGAKSHSDQWELRGSNLKLNWPLGEKWSLTVLKLNLPAYSPRWIYKKIAKRKVI